MKRSFTRINNSANLTEVMIFFALCQGIPDSCFFKIRQVIFGSVFAPQPKNVFNTIYFRYSENNKYNIPFLLRIFGNCSK